MVSSLFWIYIYFCRSMFLRASFYFYIRDLILEEVGLGFLDVFQREESLRGCGDSGR